MHNVEIFKIKILYKIKRLFYKKIKGIYMEIVETLKNEEAQEKIFSESQVSLQNRTILTITGVEKVYETNEVKVQLRVSKSNLLITGEGLNISRLDVETGVIQINGTINELKYTTAETKGNIFKKIFK